MASIREAVNGAIEYLSSHPAEAQYRDSPAVARIESGLRVVTAGPDGAAVTTDMTTGIGGGGTAPSPGLLFRAAIASCVATFGAMRAAQLERTIEALEVAVDSESNDLGLFDLDPVVPPGPLPLRISVTARFGPRSNG